MAWGSTAHMWNFPSAAGFSPIINSVWVCFLVADTNRRENVGRLVLKLH